MNKEELKELGAIESKLDLMHEDIKENRKDVKDLVSETSNQGERISALEQGFSNHLSQHSRNWKVMTFFIGLIITVVGLVLKVF